MLRAAGLGQRLGGKWIYKGLNLEGREGEAVLLTGPNGCGKTTLLRTLAVLIQPVEGKVFIQGKDAGKEAREAKRHVAFMAAYPAFYDEMTVKENLSLFMAARLGAASQGELSRVAEMLGLSSRLNERFRVLSSGWKKRTALCLMALSGAKIWLLDEPETTLDADGLQWLLGALKAHVESGGMTVIATHQQSVLTGLGPKVYQVSQKGLVEAAC